MGTVVAAAAAGGGGLSPEQVEHLSAAVASSVRAINAPPPPPEPMPENLEAAETAHRTIRAAIEIKRWTEADRAKVRLLMPQMTDAQQDEIRRELARAINSQELHPDVIGVPL